MSTIYEFTGGIPLPAVHPEILPVFARANVAFPQIYGGMIIRAGRVAVELMSNDELSVTDFSRSAINDSQTSSLTDAALLAHRRAGISVPHIPNPDFFELHESAVTPLTLRSVFDRTKRGVMGTIHEFSMATLGIPEDAPVNLHAEQLFTTKRLFEPQNTDKVELLKAIWQTADEAISGHEPAKVTVALHHSLKTLPNDANERAYYIARTARMARAAINDVVRPVLAELELQAYELLGNKVVATDVTSMFPLLAIYEGKDEFTDDDLEKIRNGNTEIYHDESV